MSAFPGLANLHILEIAPPQTVGSALQTCRSSAMFEFVEPDRPIRLATLPDDPFYQDATLWGLHNVGQTEGLAGADIQAPAGWGIRNCASNVVVAVIDSGVRATHEDLAANMWRHPVTGAHGLNAVTGTEDPDDDNGHGTMVAGILGAMGNNGRGVLGVAWTVKIMACKFVDRFGDGTLAAAIECIDYARTNGAMIINASWGIEEFSPCLSNAVRQAGAEGIIVVAAAGNRASDTDLYPYYPASLKLDNVIAVAATTRRDELYVLSNHGPATVHLAAPGEAILSTHHRADDAYATRSGTSMATPYVSGALALIRAQFPDLPYPAVTARVLQGADPLPSLTQKTITGGRLNLFRALSPTPPRPELTVRFSTAPEGLVVEVAGTTGTSYLVEASQDLMEWAPALTNQPGPGRVFFLPVVPRTDENTFFRARQWP